MSNSFPQCNPPDVGLLIRRHDHLYHDVLEQNLIRGDKLPKNSRDTEIRLNGSKVILCSLSTFANPRIVTSGLTALVPVEVVIVDEASQIEIGDYLPLLNIHGNNLKKMVFIGDDKQRKFLIPRSVARRPG